MVAKRLRRSLVLFAAVCLAIATEAHAQAPTVPAYDVVSIKLNKSGDGNMKLGDSGDSFSATNVSLKFIILFAYHLKTADLISGLPAWADSTAFDIEAKLDPDTLAAQNKLPKDTRNELRRAMLQAMLAERFHLQVHHQSKEMPIYALVIAKNGLKLKEADPNDTYPNGPKGPDGASHAGMMMFADGKLTAQGVSLSTLAGILSQQLHRQVEDRTGLTGKYDITLDWTPEDASGDSKDGENPDRPPSILTALQEQMGLKLESTRGQVDSIVVDHAEQPAAN